MLDRLTNNGLPLEIQKLRCRVNYNALRFTTHIEDLGRRVIRILRQNGQFLVLHLRYEMDMLAFSGCNDKEVEELNRMRYAYPWWKEKEINSDLKRTEGEINGGERRMESLAASYPNLVRKETLLRQSNLRFFQNHSSQMAALDYLVSMESDIFVPSYDGNMAKVVEGHRRYYIVTFCIVRFLLYFFVLHPFI